MQPDQGSSVKAGMFVIISLVIVMGGIIVLGQRSQLLRKTYPLTTRLRNAQGLIPGADVRVAGVNAGSVRSIKVVTELKEPTVVEVTLEIGAEFRDKIQADSRASIRTLGPLGDKYIEITLGKSDKLLAQSYIEADEPVDFYEIAGEAREALQRANRIAGELANTLEQMDRAAIIADLSAAASSLKTIVGKVETGPGLAHALVFDPELPAALEDMKATAAALRVSVEGLRAGQGGMGEIISGEGFADTVDNLRDITLSAKAILQEIEGGEGLAHALVYDPALRNALLEIEEGAGRFNAVMAQVQEGQGTLGLLITDPAIWESLTRILGGAEESKVLKLLVRRAVSD